MSIEKLYNNIVEEWRVTARGKGMINIRNANPFPVVLGVLQGMYNKKPDTTVYIVTNTLETRHNLIEYLTNTDNEENNLEFKRLLTKKNIIILSVDLANTWHVLVTKDLFISIGINTYEQCINYGIHASKYQLILVTADSKDKALFYEKVTLIAENEVKNIINYNENSPVEETQIGLDITDETELTTLNKYNQYIFDSVKILGSFDAIDLIKNGNPLCNISSTDVCYDIARQNGWDENLDMSIEFNKQIDMYYNPNSIRERADTVFDIIRKRKKLLAENSVKLDAIIKIVTEHLGERIMIINKSSEFAKLVTAYINDKISNADQRYMQYDVCYNYHDDVDKIEAKDALGKPILVKSGANKGKIKMLGAKAQKSLVNDYFLSGKVTIISTNSAPDKAFCGEIDVTIITSPMCLTFKEYRYRMTGCHYIGNPHKVYKLYCRNTIEERDLSKEKPTNTHQIVNNSKKEAKFDENLGAIVVY